MDLREAFPREVLQFHSREREALEPPVGIGHARVPFPFQLLLVPVCGQKRLQLIDELLIREDRLSTGGGHDRAACNGGAQPLRYAKRAVPA